MSLVNLLACISKQIFKNYKKNYSDAKLNFELNGTIPRLLRSTIPEIFAKILRFFEIFHIFFLIFWKTLFTTLNFYSTYLLNELSHRVLVALIWKSLKFSFQPASKIKIDYRAGHERAHKNCGFFISLWYFSLKFTIFLCLQGSCIQKCLFRR